MNPAEFDNIAAAERDMWWYRGMRDILFGMLDPVARAGQFGRVLDAGCGTGYLSQVLSERYGWRMVPMDSDAAGLRYAGGFGAERLVRGNVAALPFAGASFDALLSIDVISHLDRGVEHQTFAEFARVLKPDGWLVVRSAAFDALRSRHSEFIHEAQRFSRGRLVGALKHAGFRVERATYANSLLLPVALFKFRVWEPLTRAEAASGLQAVSRWMDRMLYLPLRMEAGWIGTGRSIPVGQSVIVIARKGS